MGEKDDTNKTIIRSVMIEGDKIYYAPDYQKPATI